MALCNPGFPKVGFKNPWWSVRELQVFVSWYRVCLQVCPIKKKELKKRKYFLQINVTGLYNCHENVES